MTQPESRLIRPSGVARLLPVLLLVSLAVNLLLIGAFLGRWAAPGGPPPGPGGGPMVGHMIEEVGRELSPPDRAILEDAYRAHAKAIDEDWEGHRAAFDAVRQAMRADPFDRAALERAMNAVAEKDAAERAAFAQTLLDASSRMSADGRRRIADWRPGPPGGPDRR